MEVPCEQARVSWYIFWCDLVKKVLREPVYICVCVCVCVCVQLRPIYSTSLMILACSHDKHECRGTRVMLTWKLENLGWRRVGVVAASSQRRVRRSIIACVFVVSLQHVCDSQRPLRPVGSEPDPGNKPEAKNKSRFLSVWSRRVLPHA